MVLPLCFTRECSSRLLDVLVKLAACLSGHALIQVGEPPSLKVWVPLAASEQGPAAGESECLST